MDVACIGLGDPVADVLCRRRRTHRRGCWSSPARHRVRGRVPRGGGCAPRRRAIRHACPRPGRNCHRDGTDCLGHDRGSGRKGRAGARHGFRRRHDRVQRHRRPLPAHGAVPAITNRDFRSKERAPRSPCWLRSPASRSILPNYAASALGPLYSTPQLVFAGIVSLVLYGSFVFIQTVRHRDYFLPVQGDDEEAHAPPPTGRTAVLSAGLLARLARRHCRSCQGSDSRGGIRSSPP